MKSRSVKFWDALEDGFIVLALLLFSGAIIPLLIGGGEDSIDVAQGGSPLVQAIWLGIYATAFFFAVLRWNRGRWQRSIYIATKDKFLLALVGFALVSVLWSALPEVTFRRSIALLLTTLFGVYLATQFELGKQLKLLYWALITAALLSLVVALALPSYGITVPSDNPWDPEATAGAWKGIYFSKNVLGRLMALGAMVSLFFAVSGSRYRLFHLAVLGLSLVLLLLADSATSLLVFLLTALLFFPLYKGLLWRYTLAIPFCVSVIVGGGLATVWLLGNADTLLAALGKDPTLTGRTDLWSGLVELIARRPWFGYGYEAFWQSYGKVWSGSATGWQATHAHNGFLELVLSLGLLGLCVFAIGFFAAFLRAVRWLRVVKEAESMWPLLYLTFFLLSNVTYTMLLQQNSIWWVLYVATTLSVFLRYDRFSKDSSPADTKSYSQAPRIRQLS